MMNSRCSRRRVLDKGRAGTHYLPKQLARKLRRVRPADDDRGSSARHGRRGALALCGGTDVYPAHVGRAAGAARSSISPRVAGLRGIDARRPRRIRIGAATTWSDIVQAPLPPAFDAPEGRGARGGLDPDPEPRHHRRQPVQRLARGRWRAAAAGLDASVELASRRGRARAAARRLHHRLPPHGAARRARSSPRSSCRRPAPARALAPSSSSARGAIW